MRRILSMVSGFSRRSPRSARDTVEWDTSARRAISLMEAGFPDNKVSLLMHTLASQIAAY
jgi:hypothetical protein